MNAKFRSNSWMISRVMSWAVGLSMLAVALLLSPNATAEQAVYPFTFIDDGGQEVRIERRPARIVTLGPSNTEILFAVGAGDQVVGVDEYSNFPAEAEPKPKVGSMRTPSFETIAALDPDLVFVINSSSDHRERLEGLGYTVAHIVPSNLQEIYERIDLVGRIVGRPQRARDVVAQMQARVAGTVARIGDVPEANKPRVFHEVWGDPLMTAGPGSFINELIEMAGGINIAADANSAWPRMSLEVVVERNPTVILTTFDNTVEELRAGARAAWQEIDAVQTGRIYQLNEDEIARPGPRIVLGLESIARALYPDRF